MKASNDRRRPAARALRLAALAGIVAGVLLPLAPLLPWSVSHRWFFPGLLPEGLSLRAWSYLASPLSGVGRALANSLGIASAVTAIALLIGVPAGRALGLGRFRGKGLVELMVLAPIVVPGLAVTMGVHVMLIRLGLADTVAGVVLVHLLPTLPYMVMVMSGVFANFDTDYEQQARSLGAGALATLRLVTLPAVIPGVVTGALFVFLISWSQYILTVLVGGGRVITLPLLLFSFAGAGDNALTAAVSLIFVAPAVPILLATSRYLSGESGALGGLGRL